VLRLLQVGPCPCSDPSHNPLGFLMEVGREETEDRQQSPVCGHCPSLDVSPGALLCHLEKATPLQGMLASYTLQVPAALCILYHSCAAPQIKSRYSTIHELYLHEDHHPLAGTTRKRPKCKTPIATTFPKEFILISVLAWDENNLGHIITAQIVILGLTTITDLWRPTRFRISRGLSPSTEARASLPSFQIHSSPTALFFPDIVKEKCRLKLSSKNQDERIRTLKTAFTVQRNLHCSPYPYTKLFLTGISAKGGPLY